MEWVWLLLGVAAALGPALWWRAQHRPPPQLLPEHAALLQRRLPQYPRLTALQRERLERQVARFLSHKRFYGCNGVDVTTEMAVLIAGLACLLTLRDERPPFPALRSVLVYPDAFLVRDPEPDELGLVSDEPEERIGESWDAQRIILSWPDVEAALAGDPVNVVAHECAHQLDPEGSGTPAGVDPRQWAAVMQPAFEALARRGSPVIDDYGAESPAEFFAVITESYFQEPAALHRAHPQIYALLADYYGLALAP